MQPSVVPSGNRQALHDDQRLAFAAARGPTKREGGVAPANQIPPDFDLPRKFANFFAINFIGSKLAKRTI
jgi:hypothetical protein